MYNFAGLFADQTHGTFAEYEPDPPGELVLSAGLIGPL